MDIQVQFETKYVERAHTSTNIIERVCPFVRVSKRRLFRFHSNNNLRMRGKTLDAQICARAAEYTLRIAIEQSQFLL